MTAIAPNTAVTEVVPSPNLTQGRTGPLTGIVIHHWGTDGQTHDQVLRTLRTANTTGRVSAHYCVSAGRVTQLVSDRDTAWHCRGSNATTIGIECRPEMSDADFETVAGLVAAIRSEHGPLPLSGHLDHMATACPGRWYARLADLDARARQIAGTPAAPGLVQSACLALDGIIGWATIRALQALLGTPVDGEIWGQWAPNHAYVPAAGGGWVWDRSGAGSPVVRALQARLGVTVDGLLGPETIRAWQARLGVAVDGVLGAETARAIQTALNRGGLW
ncbi:peptidoglycan recognition protein family protein [Actinomyces faecalis]|uniref:peptidoglycan recognition protein family protein n=1 Tax=Actinomyces faecalis TaxID=2722820 RepID=UPI001556332A|nr:N-acetylmuramoyl-L-alanine amidase [Actinomyces faecalis]